MTPRCRFGLAWLGTLPPAALLAVLIVRNAPGMLFMDDWDLVGSTLVRASSGQLDLEYLLAQHNESRPLFPRLLFLAIGTATHGGFRWLPLRSLLLACLVSYAVFLLARATVTTKPSHLWGLTFVANLLILSPKPAETWLWSSYVGLEPIACLTGSLALLHAGGAPVRKMATSAVFCTVATFSYANGLLTWLLLLPTLATVVGRRRLGWWALAFLLNASLYFHGYVKPPQHPPLLDGVQPLRLGHYVLAFLGASLGLNRLGIATTVGALFLVVFVLVGLYGLHHVRDEELRRRVVPWLAIGGYSVLSGIAAGVGRSSFGVDQALVNRYIPFSLYLGLSLLMLLPVVFQHMNAKGRLGMRGRRVAHTVLAAGLVTCLALCAAAAVIGVGELVQAGRTLRYNKSCLLFIDVRLDERCLEWVYPDKNRLRQYAKDLDRLGYLQPPLIKSPRLQDMRPTASAAGNAGVFEHFVERRARFVADGWAALPRTEGPADAVILAAQESNGDWTPLGFAPVSLPRPDVAKGRGRTYDNSGWRGDLVKRDLRPRRQRPTLISAWAFDAQTALALPLDGCFTLDAVTRK